MRENDFAPDCENSAFHDFDIFSLRLLCDSEAYL